MCHELGSRGPCDEDMLWDLEPESGASECRENATAQGIKKRVFDSIPANTARTAQAKKCYVDERGKCRQILNEYYFSSYRIFQGLCPPDSPIKNKHKTDFYNLIKKYRYVDDCLFSMKSKECIDNLIIKADNILSKYLGPINPDGPSVFIVDFELRLRIFKFRLRGFLLAVLLILHKSSIRAYTPTIICVC